MLALVACTTFFSAPAVAGTQAKSTLSLKSATIVGSSLRVAGSAGRAKVARQVRVQVRESRVTKRKTRTGWFTRSKASLARSGQFRISVPARGTVLLVRVQVLRRGKVVATSKPKTARARGGKPQQPGPPGTTPAPTPTGPPPPTGDGPPAPGPAAPTVRDTLGPGDSLDTGEALKSPSGRFQLVMQGDGNLVLYRDGPHAVWSTSTSGAGMRAVLQADGNLLVGNAAGVHWVTGTQGLDGGTLHLQDDGNLVLYYAGRAVWSQGSGYLGHNLAAGQQLAAGQAVQSPNGRYRLLMQGDGNLVLYRDGPHAVWSSGTGGTGAEAKATMQSDGNLVLGPPGQVTWNSGTGSFSNAGLVVQDDGNVVIYHNGHAVWTWGSGYTGDVLGSGGTLLPGAFLVSADKRFTLLMQEGDGNLVLYEGPNGLWTFGTNGHPGARAEMQTDGNFVVYTGSRAINSTGTGRPGSTLKLQSDSNLVVYSGAQALWSRRDGLIGQDLFSFPLGDGTSATTYRITQGWCAIDATSSPHLGIDWGAPSGTPVYASGAGTVVASGDAGDGYGNKVVIRHSLPNGETWYTLYGHLRDRPLVRTGASVGKRQHLGYVGSTGTSTGAHLHFAISTQANPRGYGACGSSGTTDPIAFINAR